MLWLGHLILISCFSLPQEDSDVDNEMTPPTPPPPRKFNRRGPSFKLACIGKQNSDENPLMKRIAAPLKLAQAQVCVVQYAAMFCSV